MDTVDPLLLLNKGARLIDELHIEEVPKGKISRYWIHLVTDGMGMPIYVPLLVARGHEEGPVVGLTAAVHGDELNGIPVIQRLFKEIDVHQLRGAIVGVPVVNIPSLHRKKRQFIDGTDLNHIMPGKKNGNSSQVYANRIFTSIVKSFNYLLDLHTARAGMVNSYYIRANMDDPVTREMALLQNAQIIVHNPPSDGTLRGAAAAIGIHAITLEVGDPNTFQKGLIRSSLTGAHNLLSHLGMTQSAVETPIKQAVICRQSYWIHADNGGILTVQPNLADYVEKGSSIAHLRNIFGDLVREYQAPESGYVIGKSVSPINLTGGRIIHLGV